MIEEKRERKKPVSHADEEKKSLGKALAAARAAAGYTMDAAARGIGLGDKRAIDNFEKGRNVIDAIRLKQLARLYGTTTDALTGHRGTTAVWPFSMELQDLVLDLPPEDLHFMEVAMWSHLKKEVPAELHYSEALERPQIFVDRPTTLTKVRVPAQTVQKKRSNPFGAA